MRLCRGIGLLLGTALSVLPTSVFAYRPFDSTDPAVADLGTFEVELSPLSYRHGEQERTWIIPQLRLNYGFAENWEVMLENDGRPETEIRASLTFDFSLGNH